MVFSTMTILDPKPDWSFEDLVSELNALEIKINSGSKVPLPFAKEKSRDISNRKNNGRTSTGPFVMRVLDDEMVDFDRKDEEVYDQKTVVAQRFNFEGLYLSDSDDSGDEFLLEDEPYQMEKVDLLGSGLLELSREHQFKVKEEIRNQMSALETELKSETEKSISAFVRVEKYRKERCEMERKLDTQYQRKIAEALDNHLTVVQRDLEVRSQIEEKKIRSDRDAKRREAEEKLRQERAKAEAEAKRAEEANRAALEAQRIAAKEAAEREAAARETSARETAAKEAAAREVNKQEAAGKMIRASESALKLEQQRLQKLKQLNEEIQKLKSSSNQNFGKYERQISKAIQQITPTTYSVRQKEKELLQIFINCPRPISIAALAKKVVSNFNQPGNIAFAQAYVIVRITSQVPHAMDFILAELHRACIYTVPKHYVKSAFKSDEVYLKAIGFQEDEGKMESVDSYMTRLKACMKLYGAIVQTEIDNVHGLKEGWAWLARFLNSLPANTFTAVALVSFLRMAGYSLFRKYRNQFVKLLIMISENFLNALKEKASKEQALKRQALVQGDGEINSVITELESYIKDKTFLQEPEGRQFKSDLESDRFN